MKILLAIDGSQCSEKAVEEIARRPWAADSEVKIITAVSPVVPLGIDPAIPPYITFSDEMMKANRDQASALLERAAEKIRASKEGGKLAVTTEVFEGSPKQVIVEAAERWGADLIVVGSHGYGAVKRFLLGSVSQAVALHAPCSVEIVRCRKLETEKP